jgi:two-component system sensor histidine kinase AtoS
MLTLSADRIVASADKMALGLYGAHDEPDRLVGKALEVAIQPVGSEDVSALCGPPPITYLGVAVPTSARLLVHITQAPHWSPVEGLVATVTSVNEYMAESQSLARVQLRNTVESIIAGFAHEVRNPLAAILSLTEVALQESPAPDTVLVRIPSLVARVESLLQQSLAYSRPKPPNRALHHPSFLLDHAIALLRPRPQAARLELSEGINVPPVMVDLPQGEQVLVNLLENAMDAATSRVQVRVQAGRTAIPSVCIEVRDDGAGVPPDIASRIFDPFFTTKAQGTGLGLAIARDLTRLNGGDLRFVPSPRGGAIFRMYLPSTTTPLLGDSAI